MLRRIVLAGMATGVLLGAGGAAEPPETERCVVVICHDARPEFVVLRWTVAGGTLGNRRRAFAERIFDLLDSNGDGRLQPEEARRAPGPDPRMTDQVIRLGMSWRRWDTDGDGTLSRSELAAHVAASLGPPFAVQNLEAAARRERSIAGLLDANGDGVLAPEEFEAALERLSGYDTDLDETLSFAELTIAAGERERHSDVGAATRSHGAAPAATAARRSGANGAAVPASPRNADPAGALFLAYAPDEPAQVALTASALLARYGKRQREELRVAVREAADAAFWKNFDGDGDGVVNAAELQRVLKSPPVVASVTVHLPHPLLGRPLLEVRDGRAASRPRRDGTNATLMAGNLRVRLAVRLFAVPPEDAVRFYRLQFRVRDVDRNGYLDETEFAALGLEGVSFATADADGDGRLMRDELTEVVAWMAYRESCRLLLTIGYEAPSVLQAVDADADRRWSRRELSEVAGALRRLDTDGDGRIEVAELAGDATIRIELGRPGLFADLTGQQAARPEAARPLVRERSRGPQWFRRMDRNRDGDVSRNEFVGPLELFDAWDGDGDGILTVTEAERVEE